MAENIPLLLLVLVLAMVQGGPPPAKGAGGPNSAGDHKIEIIPLDKPAENPEPVLTLKDASKVSLVNLIPLEHSDETRQDSQTVLAVHPDRQLMVGAAYDPSGGQGAATLPLYLSADGGSSWQLKQRLPVGLLGGQSYCFSGDGKKMYGAILHPPKAGTEPSATGFVISILQTDDPTADAPMRVISKLDSEGNGEADEPFIQARAFDKDRIYVGENYFGPELGGGRTAAVRVSTDGGRTFRLLGVESRVTARQDGPPVRPSVAKDGTVYVAFMRYTAISQDRNGGRPGMKMTGDIVVTRDDEGAVGKTPFLSLVDPSDGKPGRLVAQGLRFSLFKYLGQQRIGADLALAADPTQSSNVYVAWADENPSNGVYTLHVRKSTDRGQNWSDDLLKVESAAACSIAVADNGTVGLLYYQLLNQGSPQARWETHFQTSEAGHEGWSDMVLTTFADGRPDKQYDPYLADRTQLLSVSNHFYGSFSAPNFPDPNNFPQGVSFQRRHQIGRLLSGDGKTEVEPSIDPYVFHVPPKAEAVAALVPPQDTTFAAAAPTFLWLPIAGVAGIALLGVGFLVWWARHRVPENVKGTVDRILEEKIQGPSLTNYTGYLTAALTDERGREVERVEPGAECKLLVRFAPERPAHTAAEPIRITGGEDAPEVVFKVVVDGNDFTVTPELDRPGGTVHRMISVPVGSAAELSFAIAAPAAGGKHSLFVQLFQKTRLIQIVTLTLAVGGLAEG